MSSNYKVGYSRPPTDTQFKKGKSGNPKGRPKGSYRLLSLLAKILNDKITVTLAGKTKRVTSLEAMVRAVAVKAMKGEPKALQAMVNLMKAAGAFEPEAEKQGGSGVLLVPDLRPEIWEAAVRAQQERLQIEAPKWLEEHEKQQRQQLEKTRRGE